jgi:hypothetical protein
MSTPANSSLSDAIDKAEKDTPLGDSDAKTVDTPEAKSEKESQEDKEDTAKAGDFTAEELANAKQLYKALNNSETAPQVIRFLADQIGYKGTPAEKIPEKVAEAKDDIMGVLKESLGPQFDFLAEKFAPAIAKIVDNKFEEHVKDIRARLDSSEEEKLAVESDMAMKNLAKDYFNKDELPDDIINEMNKLMDRVSPSANMTATDYVNDIFYSVAGRRGLKKGDFSIQDKVKRNRLDASSRLASDGGSPEKGVVSIKMNLRDAVEKAAEELGKLQ